MGFYLTSMFNDGSGGFPDRQDIFIAGGVGDSQRQNIFQTANSQQIQIADIDGDQMPDIVYFQENVRFVGETFVRPANLTVIGASATKTRINGIATSSKSLPTHLAKAWILAT